MFEMRLEMGEKMSSKQQKEVEVLLFTVIRSKGRVLSKVMIRLRDHIGYSREIVTSPKWHRLLER